MLRVDLDVPRLEAEFRTATNTFKVGLGRANNVARVPTIYLDQNHWIDFARWEKDPALVDAEKGTVFSLLHKSASEGRLLLPASSAHFVETFRRGLSTRSDLVGTILRNSGGWQVRNPMTVRRAELAALFGGPLPTREQVVTLEAKAAFSDAPFRHSMTPYDPNPDELFERLSWTAAHATALFTGEDSGRGRQAATEWADSFRPLADEFRSNLKLKARGRTGTRLRFIVDLGKDFPQAAASGGVSVEDFKRLVEDDSEEAFLSLPGLGRMRQILHLRLANPDDRWEGNDLNDWIHLSNAAGYCDLVLGEKKTVDYLRRVERTVTPGAILHYRAQDAADDIERLLDPE